MNIFNKPLFIFEIANNHQGDVAHGLKIIKSIKQVCNKYEQYFNFGFKFQYRNLDTFIHSSYSNREDLKNVKRFKDTRLNKEQFKLLLDEVEQQGFYTICTPFDEESVELIKQHKYKIIKIASCSFKDWPLLERIANANRPVIASTAGVDINDVERVVQFFKHRNIEIALMHCVAEYPTESDNLQLNQIDLLKYKFKDNVIGFSTHEDPTDIDPIKVAVGKGAEIFEKHVGIECGELKLNKYSATPDQVREWLESALKAYKMCGIKGKRYTFREKEKDSLLSLKRGAFIKRKYVKGEKINAQDVYFAFPSIDKQVLADDFSKYNEFQVTTDFIDNDQPIMINNVIKINKQNIIIENVNKIIRILKKSGVIIPLNSTCEISHHYGVDQFERVGVAIINCINREYCKKVLVSLPNQEHPEHYHKMKEETFNVLYGELICNLNNKEYVIMPGQSIVIERGVKHSFSSPNGCVFEEISTTHFINDSYYTSNGFVNPRKTTVYITKEMLN